MIMSFMIISFKNISVTKLLKLQEEFMSSTYDNNFSRQHRTLPANSPHTQFSFVIKCSKKFGHSDD